MKGREGKGPPSADLLVCFPSRAHLTLMPKPICSPARPSESSKRHHNHQHNHANHFHHHHHHHHHHRHLRKSSNRSGAVGQASPLLWAKTKPISKDVSEPTSPKVTCAGQIKVRSKPASSCKNWQSVMEEIERLHNNRKHKKKLAWAEALGFKKDIMQFLTCLRNIRFDFRCFGSYPTSGITSDDEDDEDDDEDYQEPRISRDASDDNDASRTVFSKWFMVLQENNNKELINKDIGKGKEKSNNGESIEAPCAPPPNALLLMRCRSAPAKSWLQEKQEVEEEEEEEEESNDDDGHEKQKEEDEKKAKEAMEEEKRKKENLVVMRYGTDFYKFSSDIAKETWVVGGIRDSLARSRSWKR